MIGLIILGALVWIATVEIMFYLMTSENSLSRFSIGDFFGTKTLALVIGSGLWALIVTLYYLVESHIKQLLDSLLPKLPYIIGGIVFAVVFFGINYKWYWAIKQNKIQKTLSNKHTRQLQQMNLQD